METKENILEQIERERGILDTLIQKEAPYEEVLEQSRKLDLLINDYYEGAVALTDS